VSAVLQGEWAVIRDDENRKYDATAQRADPGAKSDMKSMAVMR
jgi:hypothetical protein